MTGNVLKRESCLLWFCLFFCALQRPGWDTAQLENITDVEKVKKTNEKYLKFYRIFNDYFILAFQIK